MTDQDPLQRWGRRAEWPLATLAVLFLAIYSAHVLTRFHGVVAVASTAVMAGSWIVFAADYAVRLGLAPNRLDWVARHPLYLAAVALPPLQPLRLVRLVIRTPAAQKAIGNAIHGRVMVYTVTGATLLVYAASLAELQAERDAAGATINSFGSALWWSITTITTVGYGNIYPITAVGRIIAAALMIGGMTLVGMITATIASWIVHRVTELGTTSPAAAGTEIAQLRDEIRALRAQLDRGTDGGSSR